jgi:IS5 family transposase
VAIPAVGKASEARNALEHTPPFRRWRAGIEGRIASLRRDYGWRKSQYHEMKGWSGGWAWGYGEYLRRIALLKGA